MERRRKQKTLEWNIGRMETWTWKRGYMGIEYEMDAYPILSGALRAYPREKTSPPSIRASTLGGVRVRRERCEAERENQSVFTGRKVRERWAGGYVR